MKKRVIAQVEGEDGNVQVLDLDINAAHELFKALYCNASRFSSPPRFSIL